MYYISEDIENRFQLQKSFLSPPQVPVRICDLANLSSSWPSLFLRIKSVSKNLHFVHLENPFLSPLSSLCAFFIHFCLSSCLSLCILPCSSPVGHHFSGTLSLPEQLNAVPVLQNSHVSSCVFPSSVLAQMDGRHKQPMNQSERCGKEGAGIYHLCWWLEPKQLRVLDEHSEISTVQHR